MEVGELFAQSCDGGSPLLAVVLVRRVERQPPEIVRGQPAVAAIGLFGESQQASDFVGGPQHVERLVLQNLSNQRSCLACH